ncbi:MAG TPA: outer membrane beta-barrel protein [Anaeromyxobacter sp.]|nr:outer membrane beta-barrel protein [Anaeromyxobacter sp.]
MTSTFRTAAALAAVALSAPASAQEHRPRLGIGVGISAFDFNSTLTLTNGFPAVIPDSIYVPINLGPNFRLEPQLGIMTLSQDTGGGGIASTDTSVVSIGLGAFYLVDVASQLDVYVGGRVVRTSYSQTLKSPGVPDDKTEGTDIRIIPALGGEYSPHPRFSLGAEVQLQLVSFGKRTLSAGGEIPGGSGTQTAGLLFARVYLF